MGARSPRLMLALMLALAYETNLEPGLRLTTVDASR